MNLGTGEKGEWLDHKGNFLLSFRSLARGRAKGDDSMSLLRAGFYTRIAMLVTIAVLFMPGLSGAQDYKVFTSEEYGFTMKYPATWIKLDKPKGNYYVVFQAPDLIDNFRPRIHVAAHSPVKDPLSVHLQEFRNGIADVQKRPSGAPKDKQWVQILEEGEFKCEVPDAYYFFVQAYDENARLWMDIVIVFYKYEQTLVRISCLAPSQYMEQYHKMFNDVLVSLKFVSGAEEAGQAPAPPPPAYQPPQPPKPPAAPPSAPAPPKPMIQPTQPAPSQPESPPTQPPSPSVQPRTGEPPQPLPEQPRPAPRGPLRSPEGPATGIIN